MYVNLTMMIPEHRNLVTIIMLKVIYIYYIYALYERFWNGQVKNTNMAHSWKDKKGMKISEYSLLRSTSVLKCEEQT